MFYNEQIIIVNKYLNVLVMLLLNKLLRINSALLVKAQLLANMCIFINFILDYILLRQVCKDLNPYCWCPLFELGIFSPFSFE